MIAAAARILHSKSFRFRDRQRDRTDAADTWRNTCRNAAAVESNGGIEPPSVTVAAVVARSSGVFGPVGAASEQGLSAWQNVEVPPDAREALQA